MISRPFACDQRKGIVIQLPAVGLQVHNAVVFQEMPVEVQKDRVTGSLFFSLFHFGCGSGKVSHISSTSPGAKNDPVNSIRVRRNAAFGSCF